MNKLSPKSGTTYRPMTIVKRSIVFTMASATRLLPVGGENGEVVYSYDDIPYDGNFEGFQVPANKLVGINFTAFLLAVIVLTILASGCGRRQSHSNPEATPIPSATSIPTATNTAIPTATETALPTATATIVQHQPKR